jgi:hypothetical protein
VRSSTWLLTVLQNGHSKSLYRALYLRVGTDAMEQLGAMAMPSKEPRNAIAERKKLRRCMKAVSWIGWAFAVSQLIS